jgi:hypothetical protein
LTLNVKLAAPDEPSLTNAALEGQMLAHAVGDWLKAHGREPIDTVRTSIRPALHTRPVGL